ncbi:MAG: hypothetical protein M1835_000473, partial [Candelina submexicana]
MHCKAELIPFKGQTKCPALAERERIDEAYALSGRIYRLGIVADHAGHFRTVNVRRQLSSQSDCRMYHIQAAAEVAFRAPQTLA